MTFHNDAAGDGQNIAETTLTPANVQSNFGQLHNVALDGQVYAQPLYVENVNVIGLGVHNVVYVATEHDSLYAIDATSGAVLWKTSFLTSSSVTTVPGADTESTDLLPEVGITSTPVIDGSTNVLYLVAKTKEHVGTDDHYIQRLHAIDITSGAETLGGPVVIADTICNNPTAHNSSVYTYVSGPSVTGTGAGSVGGQVTYNALRQNQRPGLTLANGVIYVASASHGDNGPYHGWILGYNASTLALTAAFNTTPNGIDGGIWQSDGKINVDSAGNLFLTTGNGTFETTLTNGFPSSNDYGDAVLKLAVDPSSSPAAQNGNGWGLKVVDYFVPFNEASLSSRDQDFGSSAPLLLPDSVGSVAHPHLLFVGGKEGRDYLLDRDNLGHFNAGGDQVVQASTGLGGIYAVPSYFNGKIYVSPTSHAAETLNVANGAFSTPPSSTSATSFGFPGSSPSISANGTTNGIVWDIDTTTNQLRAYSADSYGTLLFTGSVGSANKFNPPTIADGEVFVGTKNSLAIFGLTPIVAPPIASGTYTLKNFYSGFFLDNPGSSKKAGTQMDQAAATGADSQRWTFAYNGAGYYTITNVASGLVLDDPGASKKRGIKLQQWPANGGANQLWSLTPLNGGFIITNKASGLVIDDTARSTAPGALQQLWTNLHSAWQTWIFA
ncbi:MAG: RICIN domain-containing protein [Planctomycetota bacterium]|nr:RICIN domain-containing protein [Planctomycetota bacterium]